MKNLHFLSKIKYILFIILFFCNSCTVSKIYKECENVSPDKQKKINSTTLKKVDKKTIKTPEYAYYKDVEMDNEFRILYLLEFSIVLFIENKKSLALNLLNEVKKLSGSQYSYKVIQVSEAFQKKYSSQKKEKIALHGLRVSMTALKRYSKLPWTSSSIVFYKREDE